MSNDLPEQAKKLKNSFDDNIAQDDKLLALTLLHCLYEKPQPLVHTIDTLFKLTIHKNLSNAIKSEKIKTVIDKLLGLQFIMASYGNNGSLNLYTIYLNLNSSLYMDFLLEFQDELPTLLITLEKDTELLATYSNPAPLLHALITSLTSNSTQNTNNNNNQTADTGTPSKTKSKKARITLEQVIPEATAILHYLEQSSGPIEKRMLVNKINNSDFFSKRRKINTQENYTYATINILEEKGYIRALDPTAKFKTYTLSISLDFKSFLNTHRKRIADDLGLSTIEATDEKIFENFDKASEEAKSFSSDLKNSPCYGKHIMEILATDAMTSKDLVKQIISVIADERNTSKLQTEKSCTNRIKAFLKAGKITKGYNGLLKINESYEPPQLASTKNKRSNSNTTTWVNEELTNSNNRETLNEPVNQIAQVAKKPRTTENFANNRSGFHSNQKPSNTDTNKPSLRIDDLFKQSNN